MSSSSAAAAAAAAAMLKAGPPYLPTTAGLGGSPTKTLDDPITAVFLALFVFGAVCHMTILQINLHRGKKFMMSGLLFGFCMARIVTCTMRLVWSTHLHDINVAIAAQIFVAAGVILLFIINIIFAQRIVRASHPKWAWTRVFSIAFKIYYASIVLILLALIFCTVQAFFTLDTRIRKIDRTVQRVGVTYFTAAAFLPIPMILLRIILPKQARVEKFGEGRFRTKIYMLLGSSALLTLGAAFRCAVMYMPRPSSDPAWYHSKACFYIFNFTIEISIVYMYVALRVDKRFWIPNGSRKAGDYSGGEGAVEEDEGVDGGRLEKRKSLADRVMDEEMIFDDQEAKGSAKTVDVGDDEEGSPSGSSAGKEEH